MQIPIISGIYTDTSPDMRTSYPVNLRPEPKQTGISAGYLRTNDGIAKTGDGPGDTRSGIEWRGTCYRVMGTKLVATRSDGSVEVIGDVGDGGTCSMTYSFDKLAVTSGERLYLSDGSSLSQVSDPDLGAARDVVWVDGYFVTTDGEFIVVTELNDPTQVDPLKYGSSEVDPDPVLGVLKLRNELYAVNRHSIEAFQNVGGTGFPFQVIRGAQIYKGAVGTHAAVVYQDAIAFLGGGRNEAPAIWLGINGTAQKISTREIDERLAEYSEGQLSKAVMEVQVEKGNAILMLHLPDVTMCFDAASTQELQTSVWYYLNGDLKGEQAYPARHFVWCYDSWQVGNPSNAEIGVVDRSTAFVWGAEVGWQFGTPIVYGESRGGIFHELELVSLGGAEKVGNPTSVYTQYSLDGVEWSQRRYVSGGGSGNRSKRMRWFRNGRMSNWRVQRFGGTSRNPVSVARLEARIEGLAW